MASRDFLTEFFEVLRGEIAIWQIKSEKYKDRNAKQKSWEKLLKKWREIDKKATIDTVKKKYNGYRACYRRELQKIRKSKKSGASSEDLYVPSLWYFDNLDFLSDQETQIDRISTMDDSFEEEIVKDRPRKRKLDLTSFLQTAVKHLEKPKPSKDEADIYGEAWAVTFRKLRPDQKIYAKHVMDEALTYAQLGQLSIDSSVNIEDQEIPVKRRKHLRNMMEENYSNPNSQSPSPEPGPISSNDSNCSDETVEIIQNDMKQYSPENILYF